MKKTSRLVILLFFVISLPSSLLLATDNPLDKGKTILAKIEPAFHGKPLYLNPDQQLKERIRKELFSAIESISQAQQEQPSNAEILFLLGKAHSFAHDLNIRGAWQKSTKYLERCIDLDPTHVQAHFYLAKNYMDAERFADAYQLYSTAYTLDPKSGAQKFMAFSLMYQKKTPEAIAAMKSYVSAHPADKDAQKMLEALEEGRFSTEGVKSVKRINTL